MKRFDEIELRPEAHPEELAQIPGPEDDQAPTRFGPAPRFNRALTFLTDLSLFAALALALATLVETRGDWQTTLEEEWPALLALAGFLLVISYFYFVGTWLIWGRTVGGAIFDVRVAAVDGDPIDFEHATKRWLASGLSLLLGGLGFLIAALPGALSLPDRLSESRCFEC